MDGPKQMLRNIFCELVRPSSMTAGKENVVLFLQFEYAEFSGYVHFFRFRPQIPFLAKFGPKHQNCRFILKCGARTNSNMQNSMVMFSFSAFDWN